MITKVFTNGNSQAVRIPREYRLDTRTVRISRNLNGDIVLHPIREGVEERAADLLSVLNRLDEEAVLAMEEAHRDQGTIQERQSL